MPISSEVMQFVPRTAPEGLIGFAINSGYLKRAALVYELAWVKDYGIEAVLEGSARKIKAVSVTCSECGNTGIMNYAPSVARIGGEKPTYGFVVDYEYAEDGTAVVDYEYAEDGTAVGDGDTIECPWCGTVCVVKKAAGIGRGRCVTDECAIMSACLAEMPDEHGRRPLALTAWRIQRRSDRNGIDSYAADPLDAYVFDGSDAAKLTGSVITYSGSCGNYLAIKREWGMPKRWKCDWTRSTEVFGLTPELIDASSVFNCKLDEYMAPDGIHESRKWPIFYMRLWQRKPQVENLVHQGTGHILDGLFERHVQAENSRGYVELPELDLSECSPARMLRLEKDEWRAMRDMCWDFYHWKVFIAAKRLGDRMAIPGDIELLHQYGGEDVDEIIGRAPVGKCLRYLFKQYERFGCCPENEETDPVHAIWDNEGLGARELADYWRMAEKCKWNLADPAVKWPRDLAAAHDRAAAAWALEKQKGQTRSFRRLAKKLADYRYESNGILIRPAASLAELKTEGKELHHCVGSYGDAHLAGKSIFFVRRAEEPDKPWFTLQLDVERCTVLQNRGLHNCARTKEVQAFEDEWVAWLRAGRPRHEDGTPVGTQLAAKRKKKRGEAA